MAAGCAQSLSTGRSEEHVGMVQQYLLCIPVTYPGEQHNQALQGRQWQCERGTWQPAPCGKWLKYQLWEHMRPFHFQLKRVSCPLLPQYVGL